MRAPACPPRLLRLPARKLPDGLRLAEARSRRARLLGLAFLASIPPGHGLLIPRCRCVHTFGMRFALDLIFLDAGGRVVRIAGDVPPRRVARCAGARAVVETRAGEAERFLAAGVGLAEPLVPPPRDAGSHPLAVMIDPRGRAVALWPSDWKYIVGKPWRRLTVRDIRQTVTGAEARSPDVHPGRERLLRAGAGPSRWLMVIVEWRGQQGRIYNAIPMRIPPKAVRP